MGQLLSETLLTAAVLFMGPVGYANVADDQEHFLTHEGRRRRYLVHVPQGHDGKRPLPVVLGFHGGLGHAEAFRTTSRLNEAADRHGFLAVYPDGTGFGRLLTFNAGDCGGYAAQNKVDDVGFVRRLLDELPRKYQVDPQRIYATGLSNGGMLCYRLACEMSDRIAAIAPVAGGMTVEGPKPKRPVPVLHFHGRKDPVILFAGGKGMGSPVTHKPIPDTIAWWVKANGCQPGPAEVKEERDIISRRYLPAAGKKGAPVVLCELPEGGHTWPGGGELGALLKLGKTVKSVDANARMWEFFQQHTLAGAAK